jgi:hypothetical protein
VSLLRIQTKSLMSTTQHLKIIYLSKSAAIVDNTVSLFLAALVTMLSLVVF